MPPKPAAKTKKELKAEAEAAARAAEEERLRQAEEARRIAEQVEQHRQELLREFTAHRDAKLAAERRELVPLLQHLQQQRAAMAASRAAIADWDQYLSCSPLPDPRDRPAMNDFLNHVVEEADAQDLQKTLQQCEACLQLAEQCLQLSAEEEMEAGLQEALAALVTGPLDPGNSTADSSSAAEPGTSLPGPESPVTSSGDGSSSSDAAAGTDAGAAADSTTSAQQHDGDAAEQAAAATAPPAVAAADPAAGWDAAASAAACQACRARAAQHQQDASVLYDSIRSMVDAATAHVLHRADEYADAKGDVLLAAQQGMLQWGLWVNTQKNPRFKLVEMSGLGITVEIPKQLALANISLRVQRQPFFTGSSAPDEGVPTAEPPSCLAPLGGVLHVELLTLPPPPKQGKGWTIRQVCPQSSSISTVPYPIPPVGADPSTWRPDEEPPPLSFSVQLPERLLVPSAVRVGWWDASKQGWSEQGISNVAYDAAAGRLNFSSVHIGCLALLHDTSAHLPYSAWSIRPTGGLGGSTAMIELQVPGLPGGDAAGSAGLGSVSLEVGSGWVRLCGPCLPQLGHLLGKQLPLWALLAACEACGLKLGPSHRERLALCLPGKEPAAEQAMCADLASLCTRYMVASSRWNREAGQQVLLVRLSKVTDWEEGGRTSSRAAARIFSKEAAEGPWQVLSARHEGTLGVGWADGGDNRPTPPPGPDFSTVEAVQAAMQGQAGVMQASLLHLLDQAQQGRQQQQQRQQEEEEGAEAQGGDAAAVLGVLQGSRSVDAGFQGSMVQLLLALRVFSCA